MKEVKNIILYRVTVGTRTIEVAEKFILWMLTSHGDDLLKIKGCIECRVFRKSDTEIENHYLFESKELLQEYFNNHAEALRRKAKDKFSEGDLTFTRDEALLLAEGKSS